MHVIVDRFRCDLCGRFEDRGVTEDHPQGPAKRTQICTPCITQAGDLLAAADTHPIDPSTGEPVNLEGMDDGDS